MRLLRSLTLSNLSREYESITITNYQMQNSGIPFSKTRKRGKALEDTNIVKPVICYVLSVLITFSLTHNCVIISISNRNHLTLPMPSNIIRTYAICALECFSFISEWVFARAINNLKRQK